MRRTPRGEDSRVLILRAAAEVAAAHGYEGTTISRVTKRCGLPASSIYWHFSDKDELLAEVVGHSYDVWRSEQPARSPLPSGVTLSEGLRGILRPVLRGLLASPDFLRIGLMLALEEREAEVTARARFLALREGMRADMVTWFASALDDTDRPELPEHLARLVMVALQGYYLTTRAGLDIDPEEYLETLLEMLDSVVSAPRGSGTSPAG